MSRTPDRATRFVSFLVLGLAIAGVSPLAGCKQLDGRGKARKAYRDFHEASFVDAAAGYEQSMLTVQDPDLDYNLGLAYSKITKPGFDGAVLLGQKGDPVCAEIPKTVLVDAGACVKGNDRHYAECGKAKTAPFEAKIDEVNAKLAAPGLTPEQKATLTENLKSAEDDLSRYTCATGFQCVESQFCALPSPVVADMAAQHFAIWVKAQPSDEEIKKELVVAQAELAEAKTKFDVFDAYQKAILFIDMQQQQTKDQLEKEAAGPEHDPARRALLEANLVDLKKKRTATQDAAPPSFDKSRLEPLQKRVDDLLTKDQTRKLMSQLWIDSSQHDKALAYWQGILAERPNDTELMGNIAGIYLKAGDWRNSIDWFGKVIDNTKDPVNKIHSYDFIANVAWQKLNSKTLNAADTIELADRGITALQKESEITPKVPRVYGLQASLYNFRSTAHGASWAAAIDRASAQDLTHVSSVLAKEAKAAQDGQAPAPPPAPAAPPKAGG